MCRDGSATLVPNGASTERLVAPAFHLRRVLLALSLAAAGCSIDLLTKHFMFSWLGSPPSPIWWIWEGFIGFETSINTGALFGFGQGAVQWLALISLAAAAGLVFWLVKGDVTTSLVLTIAVGMILGGILGNLYDRLGLWGIAGVRDWVLLRYGTHTWPNFNVADSLLICGAALLTACAFWPPPRSRSAPE